MQCTKLQETKTTKAMEDNINQLINFTILAINNPSARVKCAFLFFSSKVKDKTVHRVFHGNFIVT